MAPVWHRYDPLVGVEASWLLARRAADDAAREATVDTLLPALIDRLRRSPGRDVRMIDIGAGSGANQRWLAPRLPFRQHWVHLDHDRAILAHTHDVGETELVVGGIDRLAGLLDGEPGATVITCAAVLDVLAGSDLELLCELIIAHRVPALLSLSVTGEVTIEPPDVADHDLLEAFDDHQRRGGRAGPDAPRIVVERCRNAGVPVAQLPTPWVLDATSDDSFVARFLTERVEAALQQEPSLGPTGTRWLTDRLAGLGDPASRIWVGHVDLLILP
jgi:hypothetical protein